MGAGERDHFPQNGLATQESARARLEALQICLVEALQICLVEVPLVEFTLVEGTLVEATFVEVTLVEVPLIEVTLVEVTLVEVTLVERHVCVWVHLEYVGALWVRFGCTLGTPLVRGWVFGLSWGIGSDRTEMLQTQLVFAASGEAPGRDSRSKRSLSQAWGSLWKLQFIKDSYFLGVSKNQLPYNRKLQN